MKKQIIILVCSLLMSTAYAQEVRNRTLIQSEKNGWSFDIKAKLNMGGTSPLPIPAEIRSIESYTPTLAISLEGAVSKWFTSSMKWGVMIGLRVENKGMTTEAITKNYQTEVIDGGDRVSGYWTGSVKTKVRNTYLTLPLLLNYRVSDRWKVQAGPYFSYLIDGTFSGKVHDGYLRETDPTGVKLEFKEGKMATFDFSNSLRCFQWGWQVGVSWKAFERLSVCADLTWGMNGLFPNDFKTISFALYPIYLNAGFAYNF